MNAYDEWPTREFADSDDREDIGPVGCGPRKLWDIKWAENASVVAWDYYGLHFRAKFGHWNGDDETVPFWKVETYDPDIDEDDKWVRCTDVEGKELLAFTTEEGLHHYLVGELER